MCERLWTYPRILVDDDLTENAIISLSKEHAHYFNTVLRKKDGDYIRLFNTRDGEWIGSLQNLSKKSGDVCLSKQTRTQDENTNKTSLFFAPIKKSRLDILIEKAVELGVTDLHPVMTDRTENRKLKTERIESQIREAAEQCERLSVPKLHATVSINDLPKDQEIYACIERQSEREESPFINNTTGENLSFLVGPEGGFTDEEISKINTLSNIKAISLGKTVYRAETASIVCLAHAAFLSQK